jgi:NAD(P)-dependent dehydrogenase (short-subunit alcohol dehydrogenase family)
VAAAFSAAGAEVTVAGRTEAHLLQAVASGDAHGHLVLDVTDGAATARAAALLRPVDILVANAGAAESAPFMKSDAAIFRRMIDLNLMGVVHAAHAFLPGMVERGQGRIIAMASLAGLKGYGYVSAYVAAKHAVVGLVRALAIETAAKGVTVNAVCPGYVDTDMVSGSLDAIAVKTGKGRGEALAVMLKDNPQKRLVRPEEVAGACLWLASDAAAAVNGAAVPISGGES